MKQNTSQAIALNNEAANSQSGENENVQIENQNGQYAITFANSSDHWKFVCSNANGGRIISFQQNGKEILVPKNNSGMFGSTFWTAPENWGWPPPVTIDESDYSGHVNIDDKTVVLESPMDPHLNICISKTFSVDEKKNGIHVDYRIHNKSISPQSFAPWEISRVEKEGLTFYRKGNATVPGVTRGDITTSLSNGICWYTHSAKMKDDAKLFDSSSDGWIAHTNGPLLFIKKFQSASTIAPGEGEIEIYACPNYVEVEQQGSYVEIPAEGQTCWRVSWYLRSMLSRDGKPIDNTKQIDRASLIQQVESVLF